MVPFQNIRTLDYEKRVPVKKKKKGVAVGKITIMKIIVVVVVDGGVQTEPNAMGRDSQPIQLDAEDNSTFSSVK